MRIFMQVSAVLGALVLAGAVPAASASDRAYPIAAQENVGDWTLIAADDADGAFHHCELAGPQGQYQVTFLRGAAGYLMVVANSDWQLPADTTYTIGLEGPGLDPVSYTATTAGGTAILILFGDDPQLIDKLGRVGTLQLHAAQSVISLPMDDAGPALGRLGTCWTSRTAAVTNPFAAPGDTAAPNANPFASASPGADLPDTSSNAVGSDISMASPGLSATGSNLSDVEISQIFNGDFSRLAELTADEITIPEISFVLSGAAKDGGAPAAELIYRDVTFEGVAEGTAETASIGSLEVRAGDAKMKFDQLAADQLNVEALLGFYGLKETGSQSPQRLYKDLTLGSGEIDLMGANCRFGALEAGEFSARPLQFSPEQASGLARELSSQGGADPTPKQMGQIFQLYVDYLTAFRSDPLQISGLACTTQNSSGEAVSISADTLGMDGLQPRQFPGVQLRNLELEVEGEGGFAAKALIVKPADASKLVATLLSAGDAPDPQWLADNARALIPAFQGLQMAGVRLDVPDDTAPDQRINIGFGDVNLSLEKYRDGIPTDVNLTAFGIEVPLTGEDAEPLKEIGYNSLNLGMTLAAHWDPDAESMAIDQLTLSEPKMGSFELKADLTNATTNLFSGDGADRFAAALLLGIQSATLTVTDSGLRDRWIQHVAGSADVTRKALSTQLAAIARKSIPQGRDWTKEVEEAVTAFIKGAQSISLTMTASEPVMAAQVIAAQDDPASALDLFNVRAHAAD